MNNESGIMIDFMKKETHLNLIKFFREVAKANGYLYSRFHNKEANECRMEDAIYDFTHALVEASYRSPMKDLIMRMSKILKSTAGLPPEMQIWEHEADTLLKGSDNF